MSDYLDPANEELLKDFFLEAESQVEMLESNILVLENDPGNSDAVDELFRAAHTLKGGAATVQMDELAEFTHLVEDALDAIREGKVSVSAPVVDTLLTATDITKAMLTDRQAGKIYGGDVSSIKAALLGILQGETVTVDTAVDAGSEPAQVATVEAPKDVTKAPSRASLSEYEILELREAAKEEQLIYAVKVSFREDNPMNTIGGIHLFTTLKGLCSVLKTDPDFEALYEDKYHPEVTYYVAADDDLEQHRSRLEISDVVDKVEIALVAAEETPAVEAPVVETPVVETPAEKPPAAETAKKAPPAKKPVEAPAPEQSTASDQGEPDAAPGDRKRGQPAGSLLRVDSRRIDNLLNLVSETVINKAAFNQVSNDFGENLALFQSVEGRYREMLKELFDSLPDYLEQIQQGKSVKEIRAEIGERFNDMPGLFDDFEGGYKKTVARFRGTAQNLGRIAGELQEGVMRIRMVPVSQIFSRFPRLVRDLSRSLKKQIDLVIQGEDTELDKSVIEDLLDPLIHCVRNSIDHGIEHPEGRREAGKADVGTVTLRASNEGNMILIEVVDDGRGIDVDAVRKKAIDRGIIHPNKQISDIEAYNLIFHPGFSTARTVTNVSGRGVGLDVVKRQIEKLNGTVTVTSAQGSGSRFTIKIPLTLAIIQGLLVKVGGEMYAIPITSVIDSHRIKPSQIKLIDNYEVFNVREDVVSLIRLSRLFRIPTEENPEYHYVVIVGSDERKMGLVVDSLIGEEDVVIKPLRDHFTSSPGIAGANITGEGKVSLIIDVSQLLELGLKREKEERARRELSI
ncbi:MAG: chemotaxis protein CheA [Spirochaetaceae bacterium]|nr:MAG: chemotaxis protein CheA [Spirochaetaceae bacterium]